MGLLDKFKKNKVAKMPVKELETPPAPEGQVLSATTSFSSSFPEPAPAPEIKQAVPAAMPEFLLPQASSSMPFESREEPEAFSKEEIQLSEEIPMPMPEEMAGAPRQQPSIPPQMRGSMPMRQMPQIQIPPMQMPSLQQQPQFRFFEAPAAESSTATAPAFSEMQPEFDVSQELLTIPAQYQAQHPGLFKEEEIEKPYAFVPQEKKAAALEKIKKEAKEHLHHYPKPYMTIASLFEVGEQLINLKEDLSLGRDTVFRLIDLNEQEIELIARWQVLQNSMEMRVAEIDKVLFKA